jgi:hypothetical protein
VNTKWMPTVAGILDIITGVLSFTVTLIVALLAGVFFESSYDSYSGQEFSAVMVWLVLFLPFFIVSLLAIIGGIFSLKKKAWGMALAGSICSILTIWGWFMGVASIIFVSLSRNEFYQNKAMFPAGVFPPSPPGGQPPDPHNAL